MSRGRQYIQFEGYFAENVLGIFRVIRGFADLRDLAAVSVPYEMTEHSTQACRVVGHQRELNEKHALDIKKHLEQSDNRFLPEVVLSCRVPVHPIDQDQRVVTETDGPPGFVIGVQDDKSTPISIKRRFSSKTKRIQTIKLSRQDLDQVKSDKLIRRIDGNHRLALAEQLQDDPTVPTKFLAPFLNTFKYVQISQAAEIPRRLAPELKAILEDAGAVLEGVRS